jgi:hypothetical protein
MNILSDLQRFPFGKKPPTVSSHSTFNPPLLHLFLYDICLNACFTHFGMFVSLIQASKNNESDSVSSEQPAYPSRDLLRRGPPRPDDKEAHKWEKWCRVSQIVGMEAPNGQLEFIVKGPFTIPMGIRRQGVSLGQSNKAWQFFTHPYHVFQADGGFFNMKSRGGLLAATLVGRTPAGIVLVDEVGTDYKERVSANYCGAMGSMRYRLFGCNPQEASELYVNAFVPVDLMLLRAFRIMTLLLKTRNPRLLFQELDSLLRNRTVFAFFGQEFSVNELKAIRKGALESAESAQGPRSSVSQGRVNEEKERHQAFALQDQDFIQTEQIRDGKGWPLVLLLQKRHEKFEVQNAQIITAINARKAEIEGQAQGLHTRIEREKTRREKVKGIGRLISGRGINIDAAQNEYDALLREMEELTRKYETLPGFFEIKKDSKRFQHFKDVKAGVERLTTNIFDYNVGLNTIKDMEELLFKIQKTQGQERHKNLSRYTMRLRAQIAPRIMTVFAISAYVLRRPDSLVGMTSGSNVGRVNRMAEKLIQYFSHVNYGPNKTLGDAFDEGWGNVRLLEARL